VTNLDDERYLFHERAPRSPKPVWLQLLGGRSDAEPAQTDPAQIAPARLDGILWRGASSRDLFLTSGATMPVLSVSICTDLKLCSLHQIYQQAVCASAIRPNK
jgi:hypothetical protein